MGMTDTQWREVLPEGSWQAAGLGRSDRCQAYVSWGERAGRRCGNKATWSVLHESGETLVCGVHAPQLRGRPTTMAMERLDA